MDLGCGQSGDNDRERPPPTRNYLPVSTGVKYLPCISTVHGNGPRDETVYRIKLWNRWLWCRRETKIERGFIPTGRDFRISGRAEILRHFHKGHLFENDSLSRLPLNVLEKLAFYSTRNGRRWCSCGVLWFECSKVWKGSIYIYIGASWKREFCEIWYG